MACCLRFPSLYLPGNQEIYFRSDSTKRNFLIIIKITRRCISLTNKYQHSHTHSNMGVGQNTIIINWNGMSIHLPSIFGFTKYQTFDPGFAVGIHGFYFLQPHFVVLLPEIHHAMAPRHGRLHPRHRWPRTAVAMACGAAVLRGHGLRRGAAQRRQLQRVDRMRRGMAGGEGMGGQWCSGGWV